jgi:hypothetical protein
MKCANWHGITRRRPTAGLDGNEARTISRISRPTPLPLGALPMPEVVADPLIGAAIPLFSKPESGNIKVLILISFCLARMRARG